MFPGYLGNNIWLRQSWGCVSWGSVYYPRIKHATFFREVPPPQKVAHIHQVPERKNPERKPGVGSAFSSEIKCHCAQEESSIQ